MRAYDATLPLYSLHVPKCGGQSFQRALRAWFKEKLHNHYFHENNMLPECHDPDSGSCVHGHFNLKRGFGLRAYYPDAAQLISVLRDPLEREISNYYYWKRIQRRRMVRLGILVPGSLYDYRSMDDYLSKQSVSRIFRYLPEDMTRENYKEYFREKFVWVGLVETLSRDVDVLARRLGFSKVPIEHINASLRDESISPGLEAEFRERNQWAFEMVDFARTLEQGHI